MHDREYALLDDFGRHSILSYHSVLPPQMRDYREHHHTECELSVFLAGSGTYAVGDKTYHFKKGDLFLFGSNEAHCITEIFEPMDLLNVHFEPRLLWERAESAELLNLFVARTKGYCHRFEDADGALLQKMLLLEEELVQLRPCRTVTAKYALFSVLVHLIRTYDCVDPQKSIAAHAAKAPSMREAVLYINENLSAPLSLERIAAVACMTPTYFSAVFKRLNGISPWEYITIKRVELAVEMLKKEPLSKLEIAARCGFSSSSNFYKAFRRITGKAPQNFVGK